MDVEKERERAESVSEEERRVLPRLRNGMSLVLLSLDDDAIHLSLTRGGDR